MRRKEQFLAHLEQFQLAVLITAYIIFYLAIISWFIIPGFIYPLFTGGAAIIVTLVFTVIYIVCGAVFYVLFRIPYQLQYCFDDIKNRIANGSLATLDELERELSAFIIRFFNFVFFDIEECAIQIKNRTIYFSTESLQGLLNYNELSTRAAETQRSVKLGKLKSGKEKYHVLLIPIWFGEEWHGYILAFSNTPFIPFAREILEDFENNFIDDQLMHVHRIERTK